MELTVSVSWEIMAAFTKEFLLSAQVHEVLTLNYNTAKVMYLKDMRTEDLLTHLSLSKFNVFPLLHRLCYLFTTFGNSTRMFSVQGTQYAVISHPLKSHVSSSYTLLTCSSLFEKINNGC